ncbi:F-box protein At3g07870-like [Papaver somniferum]|uniref:F-box protein At3g07870-like n=1 Tax=Papaver somniferum TaxID=3469 RepID=UPI000E700B6E|nr:F-box protein At3g07870-like [Papaver somniferum]
MEEDLNEYVRLEIFSHLPPELILKCKLERKSWEKLLSHKKAGFLFLIEEYGKRNLQLYYGDYDEIFCKESFATKEFSFGSLTKINHPVINQRKKHLWGDQIVNSFNGLVCLKLPFHGVNDPVYIFNPVTTEYINLPRLKHISGYVISGFDYHPLSNEYKVVRIHYPNRVYDFVPDPKGFVEIYTLGRDTEGWRTSGKSATYCARGVFLQMDCYTG